MKTIKLFNYKVAKAIKAGHFNRADFSAKEQEKLDAWNKVSGKLLKDLKK